MKPSKKDFIAEAEEILEEATSSALELQDGFNPDVLNSVFRSIHTMKGLAGLFGLKNISDYSHSFESLLDDIRMGRIDFSIDIVDFILNNIDILRGFIADVGKGKEVIDVDGAIKEIEAFRKGVSTKKEDIRIEDIGIDPSILRVLSEYEEQRLKSNFREGKGIYLIKTVFNLDVFSERLEEVNSKLKAMGEIIATLPTSEGVPDGHLGFNFLYSTIETGERVKEEIKVDDIKEIVSPASKAVKPSRGEAKGQPSLKSTTNTVRVDIDKLDSILDNISDLVMAKGGVFRIGKELAEAYGYTPLVIDIHKVAQSLDRSLTELQSHILGLRMIPFQQIFIKLSQIIRRYSKDSKKEIELKIYGEDTEIDKQIAEDIMESMVHLVRNAIDHGIETMEERVRLNKPPKGTLTLRAYSKGNSVAVEVKDDGRGISINRVRERAIEKGLITEHDVLDHKEVINLIFTPGFSTKKDVSELSGRGMGMDIVKEKIASIGGFIDVETEENIGTTFTITLPITLAIIRALIVQCADEKFAIPLTSITETITISEGDIQTIEGREVVEYRGKLLPLIRVANVFMLEEVPQPEYYAVIAGIGEKRLGIVVDAIHEQTEIVIKPLGEHLKGIPCISGAAEVGRHEIVFVVDIDRMMEEALSRGTIIKR
ncbi:MAG: chemotaxis protein CheA [Thermodesulfovibrionia bacterium]